MSTDAFKTLNIDLTKSTFKNKNLASCIPFAFYNALNLKKTLRYIALRENLDFDLNSVFRFLVCDTIVDIDRTIPIVQKLDNHFIECALDNQILSKAISTIAKYHKTILKASTNSFYALGLEPKNKIGIFYLLNNYNPSNDSLFFNTPILRNFFDKKYTYTGVYTDFQGITESIDFSEKFLKTKKSVRKLKTKAKQLNKDHICVIADYFSINTTTLLRLINYGQTFCITTFANCPLYNKKIHDWIVEPNAKVKEMYDGYIKHKQVRCMLPDPDSNKKQAANLKLICFKSQNSRKLHERLVNMQEDDKGWICFLTNDENLTYDNIVHDLYVKRIYNKIFNVLKADFFGKPILSNDSTFIMGHYTILGVIQTIINCIYMLLGYPYNLVNVTDELTRYDIRYIDKGTWLNNEMSQFGKDIFGLVDKEPHKYMTDLQIKHLFKQKENAKIIQDKLLSYTRKSNKFKNGLPK